MICSNCGAMIPDDSVFCENCGASLEPIDEIGEYEEPIDDEVEVPIEELAESDDFREIEELETMDEIEEPEFYDEEVEADESDFREIEELEAMEEVEYIEEEYEEPEYTEEEYEGSGYVDEEFVEVPGGEIPEEAALPDLSELDLEETGQPEGSETEWLESFQQLGPKEEDWPTEPEEEIVEEEIVEEEMVEEEMVEELSEEPVEEFVEEEMIEELPEEPVEEFVEEEMIEELPEEPTEEFAEEEMVEELPEEPAEEIVEEEVVEEEMVEEEMVEELPEEPAEEIIEEEVVEEEMVEEEMIEELPEEPEPEESKVEEAREAISDGADKVGAWLGNLGKSVRTGTGWAVDVAKEKASKKKETKKSNRDQWSDEEKGDLDLGYDFWYRSNQADTSSRYAGMEDEEEKEDPRADDSTTYVAVKRAKTEDKASDDGKEGSSTGGKKPRKPLGKLKITVIALVIAALLGAAGMFGTRSYTENKQEDAYQASIVKAEKLVEAKKYPAAEKIYTQLLSEYPDRAELYEALAGVYISEEKYDDAKNTVNEGVARTGKSEAFAALSEDLKALTSTEWREPFRRVLADNEWAVKQYDDKNGSCVALCDVTGDKRPEMMFFTQEYFGYGKLHIVVYENDKAQEVTYDCKNRSTQYQDAFYDIENDESGYIIYKSRESGKFGIFASFKHAGIDEWSTINRYTLEGTDCKRDDVIEACITTSYRVSEDEDENDDNTKYYKDDNTIKYNAYIKEFTAVMDDIDQVIISSENTAGDKEIWNRIMDIDEAAMTYSEAMKILDEDAN